MFEKYGSIEKCKEHLASGFANEQAIADLLKWYGSKEKAMEAVMQSTGDTKEIKQEQDKNIKIYKQFMAAKEANNMDMAQSGQDADYAVPADTRGGNDKANFRGIAGCGCSHSIPPHQHHAG